VAGRNANLQWSLLPRSVVLVVVAAALHVAVLHRITPFGVVPGTLLVVTVVAAIETGSDLGALVGFLCGIALACIDLDAPFGVAALLFAVTGWLVGFGRDVAFPGAQRVPFALISVASVVTTGLYGLLIIAARGIDRASLTQLAIVVGVTLILNPIVGVLLGPIVRRILGVNWNEA
jgi:cell shape-determining protein MreD